MATIRSRLVQFICLSEFSEQSTRLLQGQILHAIERFYGSEATELRGTGVLKWQSSTLMQKEEGDGTYDYRFIKTKKFYLLAQFLRFLVVADHWPFDPLAGLGFGTSTFSLDILTKMFSPGKGYDPVAALSTLLLLNGHNLFHLPYLHHGHILNSVFQDKLDFDSMSMAAATHLTTFWSQTPKVHSTWIITLPPRHDDPDTRPISKGAVQRMVSKFVRCTQPQARRPISAMSLTGKYLAGLVEQDVLTWADIDAAFARVIFRHIVPQEDHDVFPTH